VRKLLILAALCALTAGSTPAQAADECDGLMVCVPVAGPWVAVPVGTSIPRPRVEYQLRCPRGHIVGGLDAELSDRGIDITFIGELGSPVNPGITTSRSVVFVASYVGATARAPTFRPHIGCMPASGGGRVPTAVSAVLKPGNPTIRRVRTVRILPGTRTVASGCRGREVLVGASHAFGFGTRRPPAATLVGLVRGSQGVSGRRVLVRARGDAELGRVRAVVQVHAVCSLVR
jgi:hypothetical protein